MNTLKLEEYVPTGSLVLESFKRNQADFLKHNTKMDNSYLENFVMLLNKLNTIESTYSMTEEQKEMTVKLYEQCDLALEKLLYMRVYAKTAKLDCNIITKIATALRRRNVEGGTKGLQDALEYYKNHEEPLLASGMPTEFLNELINLTETIKNLNNTQNDYFRICVETTAQNKVYYKELYKFIAEICETGKIIYRKDDAKIKEFILKNIKSILRAPVKKKKNEVNEVVNPAPEREHRQITI